MYSRAVATGTLMVDGSVGVLTGWWVGDTWYTWLIGVLCG